MELTNLGINHVGDRGIIAMLYIGWRAERRGQAAHSSISVAATPPAILREERDEPRKLSGGEIHDVTLRLLKKRWLRSLR